MNHTKEPWHVTQNPEWRNANYRISNKNDNWAAFGQIAYANEANAKRIVACVNACAGITNEALEKGIVLDSVRLHEAILDQQPSSFFNEYGVKVWEGV